MIVSIMEAIHYSKTPSSIKTPPRVPPIVIVGKPTVNLPPTPPTTNNMPNANNSWFILVSPRLFFFNRTSGVVR